MKFVYPLIFAVIVGIAILPLQSSAAKLHFRMEKTTYRTGESGFVTLNVDTENKTVNAFESIITFDPGLIEVTSTSLDKVIINLWVQSAVIDNTNGKISFKGVTLNPAFKGNPGRLLGFNFKAKAPGKFSFSVSDFTVLANDGKGTKLATKPVPREITISGPVQSKSNVQLASSSHPDQKAWYNKQTVSISWKITEKNALAVAYLFDQSPKTNPGAANITSATSALRRNVASGTWYAHARVQSKTAGWLPTAHFTVNIDATPPSATTITVLPRQNESFLPVIRAKSKDGLSGIASYEVYANGKLITKAASIDSFRLKDLKQGKNVIEVKVFDRAGNSRSDKVSVLYNSIVTTKPATPVVPTPVTPTKPTTPVKPITPVKPKVNTPILFD